MEPIFSRKKFKADRDICASHSGQNFLRQIAADLLVQRLYLLSAFSGKAMEIGAGRGELSRQLLSFDLTVTDSSSKLLALNPCEKKINIDDEVIQLPEQESDLVLSCLNLHWINDVELFLHKIHRHLKPSGFFIANFIGGRSLRSLRRKLVDIEISLGLPARPHISPFISIDDATSLMKAAKFSSVVTDFDVLETEHASCLHLMRELKSLGEGSKLIKSAGQTLGKRLYLYLLGLNEKFVTEFEIITVYGKK